VGRAIDPALNWKWTRRVASCSRRCLCCIPTPFTMSSPPALDFPSSDLGDVDMEDGTNVEQSMPEAPPVNRLFLAGTPSTTAGTPSRQQHQIPSSPLRGATARGALGMSTPKRTPLFMGECFFYIVAEPLSNMTRIQLAVHRRWPSHPHHLPRLPEDA